jgi:hypothetical protein
VLKIKGHGPFYGRWHSESASFTNGEAIAVDYDGPVDDRVVFRAMFTREDDTVWYYVGTGAERQAALAADELRVGEFVRKKP